MPKFRYVAYGADGHRETGTKVAVNESALRTALAVKGLRPTSVEDVTSPLEDVNLAALLPSRGVKYRHLAAFARQLYQYLRATVPVSEALTKLAEQVDDAKLRVAVEDVARRVIGGESLTSAFAEHEDVFGEVFIAYIEAAETTGRVQETLRLLSDQLQRRAQIEREISGALSYPKYVSVAISLLVTGILLFLVPQFETLYEGFGAQLPLPTRILVAASEKVHWVIGGAVAAFLGVRLFLQSKKDDNEFGEKLDRFRFRIPVFGKLSHRLAIFRWTSTLSGSASAGLQLDRGLQLASRASGSGWVRNITPAMVRAYQEGEPIAGQVHAHEDLFPPIVRTMVDTGQDTGDVASMLSEAARVIDEETEVEIENLKGRINTLTIMVIAGVAGSMIVALYLPILFLSFTAAEGLGG